MPLTKSLLTRANSSCEMCGSKDGLTVQPVVPSDGTADQSILLCDICQSQINEAKPLNVNHWRCLNDSAWSQIPAVQVVAWRVLERLNDEAWARDLRDMLYLDDETLTWANNEATEVVDEDDEIVHLDSNNAVLESGDTITLIKDLPVKGAGFTAKRGTIVRHISLVLDNAKHIEGRVQGQQIVILTEFVKKA